MVNDGIILGHKVSAAGIEVDREKIEVMTGLPAPTNVKDVRSFLGHARFYRRVNKISAKLDHSQPSDAKNLNFTSHQNS